MKRTLHTYLLRGCLLVFSISFIFSLDVVKAQDSSDNSAANITWTTERLDKGIYWKNYKGDDLFDSKQSINLVELFLDSIETEFELAFLEDSLIKTSEFASKNNALVAVNGSFFNRESGGSVVFLKVDETVIHEGHVNRNPFNERGALGWSENQPIQILKKPAEGWISADFENILTSGPLLIFESEIQSFNNNSFHQNRHPRTAVAITNDRRLFLVTIDGRSFQAYGMTIHELTNFLANLGAKDALNLDGGGSTAMWIKNKTENGIVNYPSDNLRFDHNGERNIANALLILSSK
ncbi:MAG: phosphodiester glycosidase family protein [Balneolaceae bacterium]|nr:phosphodiester glycosidase family protein [Balneolaceae bacterium]